MSEPLYGELAIKNNKLERFENRTKERPYWVEFDCPEFTCICPRSGFPDFATIYIRYSPDQWCVESKALKLYLGTFRMKGEFHEACVNRIANDLVTLLDPFQLTVIGQFTPRGGISLWPTAEYHRTKD